MRTQVPNLKFLLPVAGIFLILLLLLLSYTLKPTLSPLHYPEINKIVSLKPLPQPSLPSCNKISPSLADTIIHYATSNTTPQQSVKDISITAHILSNRSPCNFLVFGLGHDSLMWSALNHGGRTVFLDEDEVWIEASRRKHPSLESYHVKYHTKVSQADALFESRLKCIGGAEMIARSQLSGCLLAIKGLPDVFYEVEWDVIMVDAPTGYHPGAPGRMGAIYTAGMAARGRREGVTDVFVHDVNRVVEDKFSSAFLCEGYMRHQEGLLRHFTIPTHRTDLSAPFCP